MTQTRLTRRRLISGAAGLTIAGLAGCLGAAQNTLSSGSSDDQPGHGDAPHDHAEITGPHDSAEVVVNTARMEDSTEFHFNPHVTWVNVGGTVTWRLESGTHTATAYHPEFDQPQLVPHDTEAWDSGTMSEVGETYSHTFDTEGVYHYLCKPHEQFGMLATVIVGRPHLEDQPALQLPDGKSEEVLGKLEELNGMVREALSEGDDDHGHEDEHTEEGHHEDEHTESGH
ncbi:MAG: plastocyanin/azurin family copper-binding protein [Halobacteriales archaeon]|nr:plastocyanin/azurin family copper-binding protein [Halobacteriales archaeon]